MFIAFPNGAYAQYEMAARPFRGGPFCAWSTWPFPSGLNWGQAMRWFLTLEDVDGYVDDCGSTFCEMWNHARDFRGAVE